MSFCVRKEGRRKTDRGNQGAVKIGDHGPVESEDSHTETGVRAEQGVDDHVVGSNPTSPIEDTECGEEISGNPIPDKTVGECYMPCGSGAATRVN